MLKKGAGYIKASRSQAIMCKRITLSALDDVSLLVRMCVCTFGHMQHATTTASTLYLDGLTCTKIDGEG